MTQACASIAVICAGASLGAVCRWLCNMALNPLCQTLPMGTLAVNLLGSFIMGMAMAAFAHFMESGPWLRLFLVTGFLGSFTTFSAFAGEMGNLLLTDKWLICAAGCILHVGGSIMLFICGLWTGKYLFKLF